MKSTESGNSGFSLRRLILMYHLWGLSSFEERCVKPLVLEVRNWGRLEIRHHECGIQVCSFSDRRVNKRIVRLNDNPRGKSCFANKAVFMERYRRPVGSAAIERTKSIPAKRSSSDPIQPPSFIEHSHDEDSEKVMEICSITKQLTCN